jgi:hypothetical protein
MEQERGAMALVTVMRDLWRHRMLAGLVVVAALIIGVAMLYRVSFPPSLQSRDVHVGIASARALVDTPSSQVVDLSGGGKTGADIRSLSERANLLASLMTSAPIKDEIAQRAGVDLDLLVTPATAGGLAASRPRDVQGAVVGADDPRAYVLRSSVPTLDSGEIPIVAVDTTAPTPEAAAKLADAAIEVLKDHVESVAGNEDVPIQRRVTVRELGPAHSAVEARAPSTKMSVAVVTLVILLGWALIVGLQRFVQSWRAASAMEQIPGYVRTATEPAAEPVVPVPDRADENALTVVPRFEERAEAP